MGDNIFTNSVINNFLTDDEIKQLKDIRDLKQIKLSHSNTRKNGREVRPAEIIDLPQSIKDKLNLLAKEKYEIPLELYAFAFARYSNEFGTPELVPHMDSVPADFTVDYQLDGNIDWPITIEGHEYHMNNNSVLIFPGEHVLHWRPKIKFNNEQYLDLIWFQFRKTDHWSKTNEVNPDYKNFRQTLINKLSIWRKKYDES